MAHPLLAFLGLQTQSMVRGHSLLSVTSSLLVTDWVGQFIGTVQMPKNFRHKLRHFIQKNWLKLNSLMGFHPQPSNTHHRRINAAKPILRPALFSITSERESIRKTTYKPQKKNQLVRIKKAVRPSMCQGERPFRNHDRFDVR